VRNAARLLAAAQPAAADARRQVVVGSRRRPAAVAVAASAAVPIRRAAVSVRAVRGGDPGQRRAGAVLELGRAPSAAEVRVGGLALRVGQDPAPAAL
jgi:hypothetical protein